MPERARLFHEGEKGHLKGIFGRVDITQLAATHAQNHRAVTVDQNPQRRLALFAITEQTSHELAIREATNDPHVEEGLDVPPVTSSGVSAWPLHRSPHGRVV